MRACTALILALCATAALALPLGTMSETLAFKNVGTLPPGLAGLWVGKGSAPQMGVSFKSSGVVSPDTTYEFISQDTATKDFYEDKGKVLSWEPLCKGCSEEDIECNEECNGSKLVYVSAVEHTTKLPTGESMTYIACEKNKLSKKEWEVYGSAAETVADCPSKPKHSEYAYKLKRGKGTKEFRAPIRDVVKDLVADA